MKQKRKGPPTLAGDTGNNSSTKNTKRKRIPHYELAFSWSQTPKNCVMERRL